MTDVLSLLIADTCIAVTCNDGIIHQYPDPAYETFIMKSSPCADAIDLPVQLVMGKIPDSREMKKIFDSGQSWSLSEPGNEYFLTFRSSSSDQPLWVAQFDRNLTEAAVYCSDSLVEKENGSLAVMNPVRYPLDQILLMYLMARKEGVILHAAGVEIDGRGFIFPGSSGAGKSTLARQFLARNYAGVVSYDRVVARKVNGKFLVYVLHQPWIRQ
jgi:hypothetical protein